MIGSKPGVGARAGVAAAVVLFAGSAAASGWTVVPVPPPGQPAALYGWSVVAAPSPGTAPALTGISGSSPGSVWAVGSDTPARAAGPQTLTLFWNGTSWATVPSPHTGSTSALNAITATPGTATL